MIRNGHIERLPSRAETEFARRERADRNWALVFCAVMAGIAIGSVVVIVILLRALTGGRI